MPVPLEEPPLSPAAYLDHIFLQEGKKRCFIPPSWSSLLHSIVQLSVSLMSGWGGRTNPVSSVEMKGFS